MLASGNTGVGYMHWRTAVLSLLFVVCTSSTIQAQRPDDISFERFSTDRGLSNNSVTCVLQDARGFLWIGTQAGLNRYDGYSFTQYTTANSDLDDDFINALHEDHLGLIWIGTEHGGVYSFDPRSERFVRYAQNNENPGGLSQNSILAIFEDQAGRLWVGTRGGGLNRFDRATGRFQRVQIESDPGGNVVWAIHESLSEPDILWIGTDRGLNRLAAGDSDSRLTSSNVNSIKDAVRSIHPDSSGMLWVGTESQGLVAYDPATGTFTRYVHDPDDPNSLGGDYVLSVHEDDSDALWIGTYTGGLSRLDLSSGRMTRFEAMAGEPESLPSNEVHSIIYDHAGVLWVGTWEGLAKVILPREGIESYTHVPGNPNSLSHSNIASIYEDRTGAVWIGTLGGSLNRLDRGTGRVARYALPFEDVIAIREDQYGSIWLGTRENRLYLFDRNTASAAAHPLDASAGDHADDIVITIYEPPSQPGVLWVGTKQNGLYRFDVRTRAVTRHYVNDPADTSSLSHNYAWPIYEDRSGVVWVGTVGGGLNRFDARTETFERFVHVEADSLSISGNQVISIHEDRQGRLWVGTFGEGLNRFERATEHFIRYRLEDGLPSNDIVGILSDSDGFLWLSTNNGVSRFDPRKEDFVNLSIADGLQSNTFRIGAAHKNKRGELFFGSNSGVDVILSEDARKTRKPPPVVLTEFRLFDEPARLDSSISSISEVILDHDENYVAFEFAVLDFMDPPKNRYAYMLDGVDPDWVDAGNQRLVRYPKLAPGNYTFRVKGANSNNVWNETGASVRLIIKPPWWLSPLAYAIYVVAIVLGVVGGYKWRVRRLTMHALELKQMVDERTEDLLAEKQKTEEQAARLLELEQVKDRFFANISHEFRTPLTLILGPVQDALDGAYGSVSSGLRAQLRMMHRSGERLHRLINQLLDLSKLEMGRMHLHARKQDLIPFVKGIVLSFASLADRRQINLQCHADVDHQLLYFDSDQLEKIIANLLSNALKFTPAHGKVSVSVHVVDRAPSASPSPSDGSGSQPDSDCAFVEIRVKDTGQGIPAAELPYIFDRFHQVDTSLTREHEGTGIGLALTKELVELHRGTIRVESEEGFGTTFFVRLPCGKDHLDPADLVEDDVRPDSLSIDERVSQIADDVESLAAADVMPESDPDDGSGPPGASAPTILIVEDNPDVRSYLRGHLASHYHVNEAMDGVEALAKAQENPPDLVISDVMMPKMDGIALCAALKEDEQLKHIPVILLTAKASDDSKIEGLTTGADDYIYKPFNAEELLARVENLIELRRMLRQRFSGELRIGPSEISVPSEEAEFLKRVRDVVESHMADSNFSVDWFAEEVGISRRHLNRKLRESANISPAGYIRMMRLERAAQLLEQHAGSVSEVAYQVGFKNADHFSRLFQQVFDASPSKYPSE